MSRQGEKEKPKPPPPTDPPGTYENFFYFLFEKALGVYSVCFMTGPLLFCLAGLLGDVETPQCAHTCINAHISSKKRGSLKGGGSSGCIQGG